MLDGSSLFTIKGFEIGDGHHWQTVCRRPTRINHVSRFVPTLNTTMHGTTRCAQSSSLQHRKHGALLPNILGQIMRGVWAGGVRLRPRRVSLRDLGENAVAGES